VAMRSSGTSPQATRGCGPRGSRRRDRISGGFSGSRKTPDNSPAEERPPTPLPPAGRHRPPRGRPRPSRASLVPAEPGTAALGRHSRPLSPLRGHRMTRRRPRFRADAARAAQGPAGRADSRAGRCSGRRCGFTER
jgi:hypothetical protein